MPPVMRFEVDLEISFISLIVDMSITDLESFFNADGVRLLSMPSRRASASKASVSTFGQICPFYEHGCIIWYNIKCFLIFVSYLNHSVHRSKVLCPPVHGLLVVVQRVVGCRGIFGRFLAAPTRTPSTPASSSASIWQTFSSLSLTSRYSIGALKTKVLMT